MNANASQKNKKSKMSLSKQSSLFPPSPHFPILCAVQRRKNAKASQFPHDNNRSSWLFSISVSLFLDGPINHPPNAPTTIRVEFDFIV